jgi:spore coat protein U-like protein
MPSALSRLQFAAALALLVIPVEGSAARTQSATSQVALLSPLSVIKRGDLDFGTLVVSGAGTAVVDPVSGSLTTTGGVTKAGSAAHPALFTGTGSRNSVVHIRLPQSPITVTRVGGTQTMTVSTWTLDGATNRKIPPGSVFDFEVGATLNVNANQLAGTYTGTFSVTVQYP